MSASAESTSSAASPAPPGPPSPPSAARMSASWTVCLFVALLAAATLELRRWMNPEERALSLTRVLCGMTADWLPFLPVLLAGAFGIYLRRRSTPRGAQDTAAVARPATQNGSWYAAWLQALVVAGLAFVASRSVGDSFLDSHGQPLPPAYHDEYSYLFQAQTFLEGRTWLPSFEPRPELFDQMHVLNEGRFASRYFPGTGAWLAPFVAWGDPWLGQQLAQALCALLVFWIGRMLRGSIAGLTAGLLFALSPGLLIFSNLLLAHHATLLGLLLFTWAFLRMRRTARMGDAFVAGSGLAFAMLCRPMTAAGVGLPFGIWFAWYLGTGRGLLGGSGSGGGPSGEAPSPLRQRMRLAAAMTAPLLIGAGVLSWYSWTITGDPRVTPYQQYTDIYTPRHGYGFNNVLRGERQLGPKVLDAYDRWAENLTPALAVRNVERRVTSSLRWSLAIVPLLLAVAWLTAAGRLAGDGRLLVAAIISLHVVHIPYWFEGIMGWHYVLESAPYWLLLCGMAASELLTWTTATAARSPRWVWAGLLGMGVLVNCVSVPLSADRDGIWWAWVARLEQAASEVRFPRARYAAMREQVERLRAGQPAVVFVRPDLYDRSMDYVVNGPTLDADVLWARLPTETLTPERLQELTALFPDRTCLLLDAASQRLSVLPR